MSERPRGEACGEEQGSRQRDGQRETPKTNVQTDQYGPGSEKLTQGVERQDKERKTEINTE